MSSIAKRIGRPILWGMAALAVIAVGGELLLVALEEAADLLLEASQAVLMLLFERGLGMPYAKAQGLAAWTSLALLALLALFVLWKLAPWVKARAASVGAWYRTSRSALADAWRGARWYQRWGAAIVGVVLLIGLVLVI